MKIVAIFVGAAILIICTITFVHWEISNSEKRVFKRVESVTPVKIDSTAKVVGKVLFHAENFKDKVKDEMKRLKDSAESK